MNYNRAIHHRRSIRLKGYDYSQAGAYFITICTHNRQQFFGIIVRAGLAPAQMVLNEYGRIAHEQWLQIPTRFANIELDTFVVMPNHIHGIIVIHTPVGVGFCPTPHVQFGATQFGATQFGATARVAPTENHRGYCGGVQIDCGKRMSENI